MRLAANGSLLGLVFVLAGCSVNNVKSAHVKTEAIHQTYVATYDAERDTTTAYARLRVGGSTGTNVELTDGSWLRCNEDPLGPGEFLGKYYSATKAGFVADNKFAFADAEGKKFTNAVHLEPIWFDEATPKSLDRSKPQTIRFTGAPLREGETATLTISRKPEAPAPKADPFAKAEAKTDQWTASVHVSAVGATGVDLKPDDLKGMKDGPASAQWTRSISGNLTEATPTGGSITGNYHSKHRAIELK